MLSKNKHQLIDQDGAPSFLTMADTAPTEKQQDHATPNGRASPLSGIGFQRNSTGRKYDTTQVPENNGRIAKTYHGPMVC